MSKLETGFLISYLEPVGALIEFTVLRPVVSTTIDCGISSLTYRKFGLAALIIGICPAGD